MAMGRLSRQSKLLGRSDDPVISILSYNAPLLPLPIRIVDGQEASHYITTNNHPFNPCSKRVQETEEGVKDKQETHTIELTDTPTSAAGRWDGHMGVIWGQKDPRPSGSTITYTQFVPSRHITWSIEEEFAPSYSDPKSKFTS